MDVFRNSKAPEWGMGLVVEEHPTNWVMHFEKAGRKVFKKTMAVVLEPVVLEPAELKTLAQNVKGTQPGKSSSATKKAKTAASKPIKSAAVFTSFDDQVRFFEKLFPGGFPGTAFTDDERGHADAKGTAGYKARAIQAAQVELSRERFESTASAELFQSAKRLLNLTNIAFPMEGSIPFGQIAEADRAAALRGLKDLLHGDGEYGARLERFAASLNLKDGAGSPKKVTWPLATLFGALYRPEEHTCVKPTAFAAQGATVGLAVKASQPVTAAGYSQFLAVGREVDRRLRELGHQPRDLMDVYSFIYRTHAEKPLVVDAA